MGLDITAYGHIKKIEADVDGNGNAIDRATGKPIEASYFLADVNPEFTAQADGIADRSVYVYLESFDFRAGSYGGYNMWREKLARLAGYPAVEDARAGNKFSTGAWKSDGGPFFELINLSDCEGIIGPITAAKLAKDFAEMQATVDAQDDDWFKSKYAEWRRACDLAAQDGAVVFH